MPIPPPPRRDYRVVLADPPWTFRTFSEKGKGRSAEAHYPCLSLEDIAALPVAGWCAPDAVLFLWATDPMLPQALGVIEAWGFAYKTVGFYWAKLKPGADPACFGEDDLFTGMGFWTRANPEPCLLATRGHPKRRSGAVRKLVLAARREHSRKPEQVHARIEALVEGPYLELFARQARPGWDAWGLEPGLFDAGPVRTRNRPSRGGGGKRAEA